jgi:hypothetical protein
MSDRGTQAAKSKSNPKLPAPYLYTGEGKNRDFQWRDTWFQAVANYNISIGIKKTNPDPLQYFVTYCSNSVADQFEILSKDTPAELVTIPELMWNFETYFLLLTSSDDLWGERDSIKQTKMAEGTLLLRSSSSSGTCSSAYQGKWYSTCKVATFPRYHAHPTKVKSLTQIMPENTLDKILTIAGKHNTANHATDICRHRGSKLIVSNTTVQEKTKQQSAPTKTSNFGHVRNPPHQDNLQQYIKLSQAEKDRRQKEVLCLYCGKGGHFASNCNQTKNNHS